MSDHDGVDRFKQVSRWPLSCFFAPRDEQRSQANPPAHDDLFEYGTCSACKWWDRHVSGVRSLGTCRIRPPEYQGFPVTNEDEWCGEYTALAGDVKR